MTWVNCTLVSLNDDAVANVDQPTQVLWPVTANSKCLPDGHRMSLKTSKFQSSSGLHESAIFIFICIFGKNLLSCVLVGDTIKFV